MKLEKTIRICHFSSVHNATDIRIFHKECVSIAQMGYSITLIAAAEKEEEYTLNSVKVITMVNPFKSRISRIRRFSKMVYERAKLINADVYHFHDPELLSYGAKLIKAGKKVIYDAHEDVPRQILTKGWIPHVFRKLIANLFERYENKISKKLSGIIAATPLIEKRFLKNNKNTICVYNSPLLKEFNLSIKPDISSKNIVYIGLITRERGIVELIQCLDCVDAELQLAGKFESEALKNKCIALNGWRKVHYHGVVDRDKIASLLQSSSIGMVTLHPTMNYLESLPIKMFEYMAAGLPVIASNFPYWRSIVEGNNAGKCVDPMDFNSIANAINLLLNDRQLAEQMGSNGRKIITEKYNWNTESIKLINFYKELIKI